MGGKWLNDLKEVLALSPVHVMLTCTSLLTLLFMCSIHWDGEDTEAREQSSDVNIFHYRKAEKGRM